MKPRRIDETLEALQHFHGNRKKTAAALGVTDRTIRRDLAKVRQPRFPWRIELTVIDGVVLVAGDCHYWPGEPSLMHRAFVAACREYKPAAVILDGDIIDGTTISRFPPMGWEKRPKLVDEIETAKVRLAEIEVASLDVPHIWTLGNHDARFETRLATVAPEYAELNGVHLKDNFPSWQPAWSVWINDDVVIKHDYKGGENAARNNTKLAGKTVITGHLHSAQVAPFSDYNGTRYGVDVGCIADVDHKAFVDYTRDNPKNWRSAFGVLTFNGGVMLQPELTLKFDEEHVQFRGKVFKP